MRRQVLHRAAHICKCSAKSSSQNLIAPPLPPAEPHLDDVNLFWTVHLQDVTDSTALCVHLTKLESHISDASFVCNHSCFFIRIKAAKEETSSGTACLLSWDHEVNCPSIEQDRPRDTSEPEGKVASLPSVAQHNAWTDHMFHQYTVQNACGTKCMRYKITWVHAVDMGKKSACCCCTRFLARTQSSPKP